MNFLVLLFFWQSFSKVSKFVSEHRGRHYKSSPVSGRPLRPPLELSGHKGTFFCLEIAPIIIGTTNRIIFLRLPWWFTYFFFTLPNPPLGFSADFIVPQFGPGRRYKMEKKWYCYALIATPLYSVVRSDQMIEPWWTVPFMQTYTWDASSRSRSDRPRCWCLQPGSSSTRIQIEAGWIIPKPTCVGEG